MENLKDYLKRKEQEAEDRFEKATTGRDQESAFSARDTLTDVLIKLKETQIKYLERIENYIKELRKAIEDKSDWGREYYYRIITGMLTAYEIVFGIEETKKITNDPGDASNAGVDLEKLKKVLEDLR